jgi:hypothetical protein
MRQYFKKVDMRSKKAMIYFLKNHFKYSTMNSWNRSTSYANNVKAYNLGLDQKQESKLYDMMDAEGFYDRINVIMSEFSRRHNHSWQAGFNGRSSGYIVLYQGFAKPSEYKSYCEECGQRNYKTVEETNGNRCGRCGENARINYTNPPLQLGCYPGKSTDMDEDFEDWDIYSLRRRVELVQEFDRMCDDILQEVVYMLDNCQVEEETRYRSETVKVISGVA